MLWVVSGAAQTIRVVESPVPSLIADKSGNASVIVTLLNSTQAEIPLQLALTNVTYTRLDGVKYQVPVTAAITGAAGALPAKLAVSTPTAVRIAVTGLSDNGESTAVLRNSGMDVATLQALRTPGPYNVQIDGPNEVTFAPDSRSFITVKNGDAMTYRFNWTLEADGDSWSGAKAFDLPPSASLSIGLDDARPRNSFWRSGFLNDLVTSGVLVLTPQLAGNMPLQAAIRLPVKLRLRFWNQVAQGFANFFATALLLGLGGFTSLVFRYFIPNALGSIRFRRQLRGMEQRLHGMGNTLASEYRVLLDAKLADCKVRLTEFWMFLPSFATRLTEVQNDAAMYNQWLDIAYAVSNLLEEAQRIMQIGMPPTVMEQIECKCSEALEPIESGFTKPEELQGMQAAFTLADGLVKALRAGASIPSLEAAIKEREGNVQPQIATLTAFFPSFAQLLAQVAANAGTPILTDQYTERDMMSKQAALLCEYHDLGIRRGVGAAAMAAIVGGAAASPANPALTRMASINDEFLSYVRPESYASLRTAQLLLSEMHQDFYPLALKDEVAKTPPAVEILPAPSPVPAFVPAHFSLRFERQELNGTAALREWTCTWNFGDNTEPERGWDVYHCFTAPGTYPVTVSLTDLHANPIVTTQPISRTLVVTGNAPARKGRFRIPPVTPEAKVEAMQLAFVLTLALSGLYATARGKVETLEGPTAILTVLAIGFGADTLKNLLTQKPGQQ